MSKRTRILVTIFGGWFGLHKFMDKKIGMGILYFLTAGLFGIGWIIDIIKAVSSSNVKSLPENAHIHFRNNFLIVGENYECLKNKKLQRSSVIKNTNLNTPVHLERYFYKGVPAYMIVNSNTGLDLGVLSSGAASWLTDYYSKGEVFATLTDKFENSFHVDIVVYSK